MRGHDFHEVDAVDAGRCCSYRSCGHGGVLLRFGFYFRCQRLQYSGGKGGEFAEADATAAADWLEGIGAVDDASYAAALARHYGERGYGPARVREELRRRGVPRELWDAALEELPDSGEVLDALIQKRCKGDLSDPKERKRTCDALLRRGFSWGEVRSAMGRYAEMEE